MKKKSFLHAACIFVFLISIQSGFTQISYIYLLVSGFHATDTEAPDLIQIPNNAGKTGEFVTRQVPETTCAFVDSAKGYFFEDDAGLQFSNPVGFIDQAYSISFNFQIDEFIAPPSWVRILSFTHVDDVGVYIKLTGAPTNGTLEFWPHGTVGESNFFAPVDFYQLILIRNEDGLIKIFVNGTEFAEYDDSETQAYVPQDPGNFIIWFRDHPSVLADEASPGFVSDIVLANYSWSQEQVKAKWDEFCADLSAVAERKITDCKLYPNPVINSINISAPNTLISGLDVVDIYGKVIISAKTNDRKVSLDVNDLSAGTYFVKVKMSDGVIVKTFTKY